ncbi:uncharacterized protein LOC104908999 isoform X2 [Beta vulgaris subsp. vulgaris]|uniref:uncharacterized protein LOC104908999 isoform X2 n=1 Tax=Beta vulgaris subsp. vulgaris TaxID=3555 RepID=UPI0025498FE7|nr:uncharacterized protein LOC104908999 isoform X2 [Beta vulgaris subsp. vulgaris]
MFLPTKQATSVGHGYLSECRTRFFSEMQSKGQYPFLMLLNFMIQLEELEKQLKIERKSTRKAEKKLNFLKKKLELLKIPFSINISEECERSISSNNSESSCLSSIASASFDHQDLLPEFQTSKSSSTTSDMAEEAQLEISVQNKSHDINKCDGSQINSSAGQQESDQLCHGIGKRGEVLKCIIFFLIINITNTEDTPFTRMQFRTLLA